MSRPVSLPSLLMVLMLWTASARSEERRGIPLRPDPPFAIDGDLSDWREMPNSLSLDRGEQVVWGRGAWDSANDASGTIYLAWRQDNLYLAADVIDDQLCQTQRGDSIWKGDHIELYLDVRPELEPQRQEFGEGQFQISFSPGNFAETGDPLVDCRPEAYCFRPAEVTCETIKMAARATERGWTLEAAIPWNLLGFERAARGMPLRCEVGISDSDSPEPKQESLMTGGTAKWEHRRQRLTAAVLAGSDGVAPEVITRVPLFEEVRLARDKTEELTFQAPAFAEGRDAVLVLNARMDTPKVAGHTPALRLFLNGSVLAGERLINKPARVTSRGGSVYSMVAGDRYTTYYSPDFTSPDLHPHYGLLEGIKACDFAIRVTDLIRAGENKLVIHNAAAASITRQLVVANGRLESRLPPPPKKERAPAPTGSLPTIEPLAEPRTDYTCQQRDNSVLAIEVGGEEFLVESRFSTPRPAWVTSSNEFFRHQRVIHQQPELIVVEDTLTNLTDENLALMHRHEVPLGDRLAELWLAGLRRHASTSSTSETSNPTSFATTAKHGLGLIAISDAFRIHVRNYALEGRLGLADSNLVLPPKATHTLRWAIIPTPTADYWRFLNAARRLVKANFTIPGTFAFLRVSNLTKVWSDEQTRNFIQQKDAMYVCASIGRYKGRYAHGTAFQQVQHEPYREAFARRRRLVPDVQNLVYFHCFLDVTDEAPERFADSRTLRPDGQQADYGKPHQRIFHPTQSNSFGKEIGRNVDIILDKIGAEGVYWDEHEYSAYSYHYGEPWDGVSGDIDPKRMTIRRLKSSVTLLSQAWRLAMVRRIMKEAPLIGNGMPRTEAMAATQFPCFVETGSISNCAKAQLYSPIALGDHLTERSELNAYKVMLAALDYGCVYHWYNDVLVIPTHHHLTRVMYPITPLELHAGYVIGRERIITKRSGLFGWGDDTRHKVHVFDHEGREVDNHETPLVTRQGRTYSELRLPEDWSAAIVRK